MIEYGTPINNDTDAFLSNTTDDGTADINPAQDHGFMFSRSLADPDGHVWEAFWMDPAAVPQE